MTSTMIFVLRDTSGLCSSMRLPPAALRRALVQSAIISPKSSIRKFHHQQVQRYIQRHPTPVLAASSISSSGDRSAPTARHLKLRAAPGAFFARVLSRMQRLHCLRHAATSIHHLARQKHQPELADDHAPDVELLVLSPGTGAAGSAPSALCLRPATSTRSQITASAVRGVSACTSCGVTARVPVDVGQQFRHLLRRLPRVAPDLCSQCLGRAGRERPPWDFALRHDPAGHRRRTRAHQDLNRQASLAHPFRQPVLLGRLRIHHLPHDQPCRGRTCSSDSRNLRRTCTADSDAFSVLVGGAISSSPDPMALAPRHRTVHPRQFASACAAQTRRRTPRITSRCAARNGMALTALAHWSSVMLRASSCACSSPASTGSQRCCATRAAAVRWRIHRCRKGTGL